MRAVEIADRIAGLLGIKGWSLYHRIGLLFLIAAVTAFLYQLWYAGVNGTYKVRESALIEAPAEAIWSLIIDTDNRVRWQAQIVAIARLKDEPTAVASTRILTWRNMNRRRWTALEETTRVIPGLLYATYQQSEKDERSLEIKLEPINACKTRVTLEERILPLTYDDRLIAPLLKFSDVDRFERSFAALSRWATPNNMC